MRRYCVFPIAFVFISAGQLVAQSTAPVGSGGDPFGPLDNASPRIVPVDTKPTPRLVTPAPQENLKGASQPTALYPCVRVGQSAAAHERITLALSRETTFDYLDQPLKDVVEDISFSNKIPITIDTRALEDFGIDTATPVTISLTGISLRSALRLLLHNLELTFVIRDEVLQITTPESAAAGPSFRFYHVAELLPSNGDGQVLVDLIKTLVVPNSWCGSDGVGSILYVDHLESLAIRQTDDVFYEIEELLAKTKQLVEMQSHKD